MKEMKEIKYNIFIFIFMNLIAIPLAILLAILCLTFINSLKWSRFVEIIPILYLLINICIVIASIITWWEYR